MATGKKSYLHLNTKWSMVGAWMIVGAIKFTLLLRIDWMRIGIDS